MEKLHINSSQNTPEIILSPADYTYTIKGISAPEDVRAIYYPVIEWLKKFTTEIKDGNIVFTLTNPLRFKVSLEYFNSSSAKFLYDIFIELREMKKAGIPVIIEWHYHESDADMWEAGMDISSFAEMEFEFVKLNT